MELAFIVSLKSGMNNQPQSQVFLSVLSVQGIPITKHFRLFYTSVCKSIFAKCVSQSEVVYFVGKATSYANANLQIFWSLDLVIFANQNYMSRFFKSSLTVEHCLLGIE